MRFVFTWLPCWSEKHHYSGVYRGSKFMHFDKSCAKMSQNHTSNLDKVFLNVPPSSDFGLEARILQIGWFYRPKWKKVEKSASKNKHPIKLRFLIWRLQSANPEKKVIPENQGFGSCPLESETARWLVQAFSFQRPYKTFQSNYNHTVCFQNNLQTSLKV